jgi:hypothetical protein
MRDFLQALPTIASSPLAFVAYVILIAAWLVAVTTSRKSARLFKRIKALPEKDRLPAIELEYRTVPAAGVTAAQWLAAKEATYRLVRYCALVVLALVVVGMLGYLINAYFATAKLVASQAELQRLLDDRAQAIADKLRQDGDPQRAERFMQLHKNNLDALKTGNLIQAHELQDQIWTLLEPPSARALRLPDSNRYHGDDATGRVERSPQPSRAAYKLNIEQLNRTVQGLQRLGSRK